MMNKNIGKMINKVMPNKDLIEELLLKDTFDDVYEFCISVSGGYTKQEFEEFLEEALDDAEFFAEQMDDENMLNVAGGKNKNIYSKILATSLATLTLASSAGVGAVSDKHKKSVPSDSAVSAQAPKQSFWSRNKSKIIWTSVSIAVIAAFLVGRNYYQKPSVKGADLVNKLDPDVKSSETVGVPVVTPPAESGSGAASSSGAASGSAAESGVKKITYDGYQKDFLDSVKNFFTGFPTLIKFFATLGIAATAIDSAGSLADKISKMDNAVWPLKKLKAQFLEFRDGILKNFQHTELSLTDAFGNLKYLFEVVKGQEGAKKQIESIVYGILHRKNQAKLMGKKYDRGDVLYFYGPSGVGKTLVAQGLATYQILTTNPDFFYISASEVDKESKETVVDQLFGRENFFGGFDDFSRSRVVSAPKNLVKYLENNSDGVVIIDEYDKMWSPNLDEIFRTITDHGVINVKGKTIDCSGITFILTSNESTKSIQGGNQTLEFSDEVDDGTGSRTQIRHDKSFINRLQPVEFKNLTSKEYAQIIDKEFRDDLVDYWANPEVSGVEVVIGDKCLENMAKAVERKNIGARHIIKLQADLFCEISKKLFDVQSETGEQDFYRGKKLFVKFDPDKGENNDGEFTLSDDASQ